VYAELTLYVYRSLEAQGDKEIIVRSLIKNKEKKLNIYREEKNNWFSHFHQENNVLAICTRIHFRIFI